MLKDWFASSGSGQLAIEVVLNVTCMCQEDVFLRSTAPKASQPSYCELAPKRDEDLGETHAGLDCSVHSSVPGTPKQSESPFSINGQRASPEQKPNAVDIKTESSVSQVPEATPSKTTEIVSQHPGAVQLTSGTDVANLHHNAASLSLRQDTPLASRQAIRGETASSGHPRECAPDSPPSVHSKDVQKQSGAPSEVRAADVFTDGVDAYASSALSRQVELGAAQYSQCSEQDSETSETSEVELRRHWCTAYCEMLRKRALIAGDMASRDHPRFRHHKCFARLCQTL